jgi:hypothetical protein
MDDGLLRRCSIIEDHLDSLGNTRRPVAERIAFSKKHFAVAGPVPVSEPDPAVTP